MNLFGRPESHFFLIIFLMVLHPILGQNFPLKIPDVFDGYALDNFILFVYTAGNF